MLFVLVVIAIGVLVVSITGSRRTSMFLDDFEYLRRIVCLCYLAQNCELHFRKMNKAVIQYNHGPRSAVIGDLNGDTWPDMVDVNNIAENIVIYFGNSIGVLVENSSYSTGLYSAPNMVAVGDLNNDSRLDIAVVNSPTNNIGIFLGLENGLFANQMKVSTASSRPIAIHLADFNNDTFLDIVTANYGTNSISIFYALGKGHFSNSTTYSTGYDSYPSSLVAGDFNNDQYLDVAVANYGTDNVGLFLGNNHGGFANQTIFSMGSGSRPTSIAVAHLNEDNLLDIAVANFGTGQIGLLLNNGNGTFVNRMIHMASPYSISIDDLNNDKRMDLVITNKGIDNIGVLLGYGNSTFGTARMYRTGSFSSFSSVVADLNKDNRIDLIVVNDDTGAMDVLFGYFEGISNPKTYLTGDYEQGVAAGDFNNDARLDIVIGNSESGEVSVLLGYGDGSFADQMTYATGIEPQSVAVGDFNNDTHLDIVVANWQSNDMSVLLGYGNGSFANQTVYSIGTWPTSVAVGDFNNDAHLDIVITNDITADLSILLGYGDGSFSNQIL